MREGERLSENEMFDALVARLRVLPESDPRSRAAILARVHGRRQSPWRASLATVWQQWAPQLAVAAAVVVLVGVGYGARVLVEPSADADIVATNPPASTIPAVQVSNIGTAAAVPTTFILKADDANRVALVGDFNGWDRSATQLSDPSESGVWQVTVALPPGRHTYAFLVNDSVWTVDPRRPQERDPDFGSSRSVILVTAK